MLLVDDFISWQAWAVKGGSEGIADHFYELVPDMALDFPYELDNFQKEVFVYEAYWCMKLSFILYLWNRSVIVRFGFLILT